jgi:anaerobic dimethyl sulfoxide reductase subunit B (iron-sulfur subunit)
MKPKLVFSFQPERCTGCMACMVACLDQNDLPPDAASLRQVTLYEPDTPEPSAPWWMSLACQHCEDAPCMQACITGAIYRCEETGFVKLDSALCVGCHTCGLACPFGAPRFMPDGKMHKCDFCAGRVSEGLMPACVQVCPTGALGVGEMNRMQQDKAGQAARSILLSTMCKP